MAKMSTWVAIHTKRFVGNPFILAILILLPVIAFLMSRAEDSSSNNSYKVGLYVLEDSISKELCGRLLDYSGSIEFIEYKDVASLIRDIQNSKLSGGYVLPDDLTERTIDADCTDSILSMHAPASAVSSAANEIVYAELIAIQGRYIITEYVERSKVFADAEFDYKGQLLEKYQKYLTNGSTFSINHETYSVTNGAVKSEDTVAVNFPIRGLLAVIVYVSAILGLAIWQKEYEAGVFSAFRLKTLLFVRLLYVVIPPMLFAISSLFAIGVSGNYTGGIEFGAMLFLVAASAAWAWMLSFISAKSQYTIALLPMLLVCALLFCPIFINLTRYIEVARFIEKIFVPYYYLRFFA